MPEKRSESYIPEDRSVDQVRRGTGGERDAAQKKTQSTGAHLWGRVRSGLLGPKVKRMDKGCGFKGFLRNLQ